MHKVLFKWRYDVGFIIFPPVCLEHLFLSSIIQCEYQIEHKQFKKKNQKVEKLRTLSLYVPYLREK
jgi:hypothetical protein